MKTNELLRNVAVPAASAGLLFLGACGEDGEDPGSSSDLLIGEWNIESIKFTGPNESYTAEYGVADDGYIYRLTFEFQADGDFFYCSSYEESTGASGEDCYEGEWEWVSVNDKMNITVNAETTEVDIISLSESDLVFEVTVPEFYENNTYELEYTAVKVSN